MLIVGDSNLPWVVYPDASQFAVSGILLQDQGQGLQLVAFGSKKLSPTEHNYATHEREALAIVHCLKTGRCYFEGRSVIVYTDHHALKFLQTQPVLSRKQARWMEFLQQFTLGLST